jgi:hypothetical protein
MLTVLFSLITVSVQTSIVVELPAASTGRRRAGSTRCFGEELALHELMVISAEAVDKQGTPEKQLIHLAVEVGFEDLKISTFFSRLEFPKTVTPRLSVTSD